MTCSLIVNYTFQQIDRGLIMKISIVIPAYRESGIIGTVITSISRLLPDAEIIVVDDGSDDGTGEAARRAGALVYSHPYNIGNGAAVKTGHQNGNR